MLKVYISSLLICKIANIGIKSAFFSCIRKIIHYAAETYSSPHSVSGTPEGKCWSGKAKIRNMQPSLTLLLGKHVCLLLHKLLPLLNMDNLYCVAGKCQGCIKLET